MALTEAKGTLEEQARTVAFAKKLQEEKELKAAREAAITSDPALYEDASGNQWTYVVVGDEFCRIQSAVIQSACVTIPLQIGSKPVKEIAHDAFAGQGTLQEIVVGEQVEKIGAYAFRNCVNLKRADLACLETCYDPSWLKNCGALEELCIPQLAVELKPNVFDNAGLRKLRLGRAAAVLEPGMFAKSKLDAFEIDSQNANLVTDGVGIYSIDGDKELVALAKPVQSYAVAPDCVVLGKKATSGFAQLEQLELPDGIAEIGEFALAKTAVEAFKAPASLKEIKKQAFFNCKKLTQVTLNDGLETIGDEAFCNTAIEYLRLPKTVKSLGKKVVDRTPLRYSGPDATFAIDEASDSIKLDRYGVLYAIEDDGLHVIRAMDSSVEEIELLEGTVSIDESAFAKQNALVEVKLPEGLQVIGRFAFRDCHKLVSVNIPTTVREIGDGAFMDTEIRSVAIPASLEKLGVQALVTRGAHHEEYVPSLSLVEVDPASTRFYKECGMLIERMDDVSSRVVIYDGSCDKVVFPDEVDTVCDYAFKGSVNVRELHVSDKVKHVGLRALAFENLIQDVYIHCDKPLEGQTDFHFRFPDTKRGQKQQNNAFGLMKEVDVEMVFRGYDLSITNAAKFDAQDDDLALYDQAKHLIARMKTPIFLAPVHKDTIAKMFTFNLLEICVALARHDDRDAIDDLVGLGYLKASNICEVCDEVAKLQDAAMTGHLLKIIKEKFGLDTKRFEL